MSSQSARNKAGYPKTLDTSFVASNKAGYPKTPDDWSSYPVVPDLSEEALCKRAFGNDASKKSQTSLTKKDHEKMKDVARDVLVNYRKQVYKWKQDHPKLAKEMDDACPNSFS